MLFRSEPVAVDAVDEIAGADVQLLDVLRALTPATLIIVPLEARGRVLGALTLVAGAAHRRFQRADLGLAEELARRAGLAIDNLRLYREADRRGDAARALAYVSDGVLLLDASGVVRYLNPAARTIRGVDEGTLGRPATEVLPDWRTVAERVRANGTTTTVSLPLLVDGCERWVTFAAVAFDDGIVFALRDVGEERALEQARSDFVATASHELRTPTAAIYGAVRTLRRDDIELRHSDREAFLGMIEDEADRLARIVEQILLARELESGGVEPLAAPCNAADIVRSVVDSVAVRDTRGVRLHAEAPGAVGVRADEDKLR